MNSLPENPQTAAHHHLTGVILDQQRLTCQPRKEMPAPPPASQAPPTAPQAPPLGNPATRGPPLQAKQAFRGAPPHPLHGPATPARLSHRLGPIQQASGRGKPKCETRAVFTRFLSSKTSQQQSNFLLFESCAEIGGLQATLGDKMKSRHDGKKMIDIKHRHFFSRHMTAFCSCVHLCHSDDLFKFQQQNPALESTHFERRQRCTR